MEFTLIRSNRKTVALQITPEGLVVRAPYFVSHAELQRVVESRRAWVEKHLAKARQAAEAQGGLPPLTPAELQELTERAKAYFPARTEYWARRMGVTYTGVAVRRQKTRWGSCSAKGSLSFNCLLMLAPPETVDSVIVHELAHRKEMNHSPRFYAAVYAAFPEYDVHNGWLKKNGAALMARLPAASPR